MPRSKQKKTSVLTPFFFFFLFLAAASYFIWNTYYTPQGIVKETIIISGGDVVQVRLGESPNFFGTNVDSLLEGESIRSSEGGAQLEFFDGSTLTLDAGTTVTIALAREREKDSAKIIHIELENGRVWLSATQKINPGSEILLKTPVFSMETKGGEFSITQEEVVALSGSGIVEIKNIYSEDIEVGQAITLTSEDVSQIEAGGRGPQKTSIPVNFQESNWFAMNTATETKSESDLTEEDDIDTPLETEEDDTPVEVSPETNDIFILFPGENDEVVEVEKNSVPISGTVPEGTVKVIVNDYTLSQFAPGDTSFQYNAAIQWGTLEEGRNEYTIVALGEDDKRYEAEITIIYTPEGAEEGEEENRVEEEGPQEESEPEPEENKAEEPEEDEVVTGGLTITSPEEGVEITEDLIEVTGEAPSNAVDIRVNDYILSAFNEGDNIWKYRISSAIGNRTAGEYTITAEALGEDGNILQTATRNFIIEPLSGTNEKYMPELRGGTLPPIKQDDSGGPTI